MRRRATAAVLGLLLSLSACGGSSPGELRPELTDTLTRIDRAIERQHYRAAHRNLTTLVTQVDAAQDEGNLPAHDAEKVLAAAARLLAALPR